MIELPLSKLRNNNGVVIFCKTLGGPTPESPPPPLHLLPPSRRSSRHSPRRRQAVRRSCSTGVPASSAAAVAVLALRLRIAARGEAGGRPGGAAQFGACSEEARWNFGLHGEQHEQRVRVDFRSWRRQVYRIALFSERGRRSFSRAGIVLEMSSLFFPVLNYVLIDRFSVVYLCAILSVH